MNAIISLVKKDIRLFTKDKSAVSLTFIVPMMLIMIFGLIFLLISWVGLIALAIWLVRSLFTNNQRYSGTSKDQVLSSSGILDLRYARGEITREQYDLMKQNIQ